MPVEGPSTVLSFSYIFSSCYLEDAHNTANIH